MFKNYFKIAYRNLLRQKGYSFINIFGLAVGLTCCLLIVFFVLDELSYDRFHDKADRIYRVTMDFTYNDAEMNLAVVGPPVAPTLVQEFPEVENAVRFARQGSKMIKYGEKTLKEEAIIYADSSLFQIFTLPLVQGDPQSALREPNTVVVSESAAEKYFGDEDPMGKVVRVDDFTDYKVVGVFQDIPINSHFHANMIGAFKTLEQNNGLPDLWLSMNHPTYVLLREGADPKALEAKLPGLVERYVAKDLQQFMNSSLEQFETAGNRASFGLQPLTSIHLHSELEETLAQLEQVHQRLNPAYPFDYQFLDQNFERQYRSETVIGKLANWFAFIAILISCLGLFGLAAFTAERRTKEIGIRKVLGASVGNIVGLLSKEFVRLVLIAFVITSPLAWYALRQWLQDYPYRIDLEWWMFALTGGAALLIALLTVSYQSIKAALGNPVKSLKSE
jgi:putative ABC transport system permease protein